MWIYQMTVEEAIKLPGMKFLGELKEGTKLCIYNHNFITLHPDEPPMIITSEGFINLTDWKGHYRSV